MPNLGVGAQVLKRVTPEEVVDIDSALCRESLDVIGAHVYTTPRTSSCIVACDVSLEQLYI